MNKYDVAIIGGGPGGIFAHAYASRQGLKSCLFEANNELGGQPRILFPIKAIHDFPQRDGVSANDLTNELVNQIEHMEDVFLNTPVTKFEATEEGYVVNNIIAKYIIIATGGGFFRFNKIDGVESKNIHYVVKDINLYKDKKVVLCGGGDSALDWTYEILSRNLTSDFTLVHRRNEFRAQPVKVEKVKPFNIKYEMNKTSKVLDDHTLELTDNVTKETKKINFDYLIVQFGQSYSLQDNSLLGGFELDCRNKIIVDANCKTQLKNIYAIGNVASFNNKPCLIITAVNDAKKAIDHIRENE